MRIYFDESDVPGYVDDLAPAETMQHPARRGLRNWQKFMACYGLVMTGGALILYSIDGVLTALVGLAIWLLTALIILAVAGQKGRL